LIENLYFGVCLTIDCLWNEWDNAMCAPDGWKAVCGPHGLRWCYVRSRWVRSCVRSPRAEIMLCAVPMGEKLCAVPTGWELEVMLCAVPSWLEAELKYHNCVLLMIRCELIVESCFVLSLHLLINLWLSWIGWCRGFIF